MKTLHPLDIERKSGLLLMDRRQINKTHLCSTGPKLISVLIRVVGAISPHNDNILNILIGYDDQQTDTFREGKDERGRDE